MVKKFLAVSILIGATVIALPHAQAAAGVTCKTSTAVGHSPAKLPLPVVKKPFKEKTITMSTNCGEIVIDAFGVKAPLTVTSMAYMANKGYFDHSLCHRLTTQGIFVVQCGDPTASGTGGPAWTVPDENLPKGTGNTYPAGTVAMANSGPNTNGSQFFFVYKDGSQLGPNYTIWGKVVKGLNILQYVASKGVSGGGADGALNQPLEIVKASAI
jgi:peptidyl-prolyl cis-trans isomerase B (cyclophilin B)